MKAIVALLCFYSLSVTAFHRLASSSSRLVSASFSSSSSHPLSSTSLRMSSLETPTSPPAASSPATTHPSRVIIQPLPVVYVYDHCPFCVRVRLGKHIFT